MEFPPNMIRSGEKLKNFLQLAHDPTRISRMEIVSYVSEWRFCLVINESCHGTWNSMRFFQRKKFRLKRKSWEVQPDLGRMEEGLRKLSSLDRIRLHLTKDLRKALGSHLTESVMSSRWDVELKENKLWNSWPGFWQFSWALHSPRNVHDVIVALF